MRLKDDTISKVTELENTGLKKPNSSRTDLGLVVTDFLNRTFQTGQMDHSFTANIEKEFDEIAGGRLVEQYGQGILRSLS